MHKDLNSGAAIVNSRPRVWLRPVEQSVVVVGLPRVLHQPVSDGPPIDLCVVGAASLLVTNLPPSLLGRTLVGSPQCSIAFMQAFSAVKQRSGVLEQ